MQTTLKPRTIFCRDNLEIMRGINSDSVDLIYLDPPFNKGKKFHAPIGSTAEGAEFSDIWSPDSVKDEWHNEINDKYPALYKYLEAVGDIGSRSAKYYLIYMAVRLIEMHRILKPSGSIYFHCDQTVSHYIKLLMDTIFNHPNARGEIVWQRSISKQKGSQHKAKSWGVSTDSLFFYTKTDSYNLVNTRFITEEEIFKKFNHENERTGEKYYDDSSHIWCTPGMGVRPELCYKWKGFENPHPSGWRLSKERLQEEYEKGNIVILGRGTNKKLQRRKYIKDYEGVPLGNLWTDINPVSGKENTKYPTQKPLALLERIIQSSSNIGDLILDPFCGCATTCVAAEKLKRNWIGIDVSAKAYELCESKKKLRYRY